MKQQAKIISIPVTEVTKGRQIIFELNFEKNEWISDSIIRIMDKSIETKNGYLLSKDRLKTIVAEYDAQVEEAPIHPHMIQFPLKDSDWQKAIDEGLIDSGKIVDVQIIPKEHCDCPITDCNCIQPNQFATLIPQQKRMYSKEEVMEITKKFWFYWYNHIGGTNTEQALKEWFEQNVK